MATDELGDKLIEKGHDVLKEGIKKDEGKDRWELLPVNAVRQIVKVFTHGAVKYDSRNWEKGIKFGRVYAALQRHLNAWWEGEDNDSEFGLSHLAHAGCCLLFLLHYSLFKGKYKEFDDRPYDKKELKEIPLECKSFCCHAEVIWKNVGDNIDVRYAPYCTACGKRCEEV